MSYLSLRLSKKLNHIAEQLWLESRRHVRECISPGCTNRATIRSHIIQRNGVITEICDKRNEVVRLWTSGYGNNENSWCFERTRSNEALSFVGYCTECDNNLFRSIERNSTFDTRDSALLLWTMRALAHEAMKKVNNVYWYESILDDYRFQGTIAADFAFKKLQDSRPASVLLKNLYERVSCEHASPSGLLEFSVKEIERIDLCCSTFVFPAQILLKDHNIIPRFVLFTTFPRGTKSITIEGWPTVHGNLPVSFIPNRVDLSMTRKTVSDYILLYSEDIALSSKLFLELKPHVSDILDVKDRLLYTPAEKLTDPGFDMFALTPRK
ncbi:MAG TPA: hypothetical protein VI306_04280 [Pyrinomonadaceae bacterium]